MSRRDFDVFFFGTAIAAAHYSYVLLLDKPTNRLDLEAPEHLETALEGHEGDEGTIVVVTRDRRFLERLRPTRTLEL